MSEGAPTKYYLIALPLGLMCAGVIALTYNIPSEFHKMFGAFLTGIGVLNILLSRINGRMAVAWTKRMPKFISNYWETIGIAGARAVYLGLGIIFAGAGLILILLA